MSWQHFTTEIQQRPAQVLIDDRFSASTPTSQLPRLAWFAVYCQQPPASGFWHPEESSTLDAIESDLIRLCEQFGRGWAVYVARIATRGLREYFLYFGETATPAAALASLRAAHPNYRIEYDETADDSWQRYGSLLPSPQPIQ